MRTRAALTTAFRRVRDFFAANVAPAVYGPFTLAIAPGVGAASFTPGPTAPAADYDVTIQFDVGGTVGAPGIVYRTSLNGDDLGPPVALGTATEIDVLPSPSGVSVSLGAGTIPTGQILTFETEAARRTAVVLFGWTEYTKQINQSAGGANRIVFVPGDSLDAGKEGAFTPPLSPGARDWQPVPPVQPDPLSTPAPKGLRGRRVFDWSRLATISVWGVDPARPQDDEASYEAVDRLVEDLIQAMQKSPPYGMAGLFKLGAPAWGSASGTQRDRLYGRELLIPLEIRGTVYDIPGKTVAPSPKVNRNPAS